MTGFSHVYKNRESINFGILMTSLLLKKETPDEGCEGSEYEHYVKLVMRRKHVKLRLVLRK